MSWLSIFLIVRIDGLFKTLPTSFPTCTAQSLTESLSLRRDNFSYILWAGDVDLSVLVTVDIAIMLPEVKKYVFSC